jgi:hypothetical protein
VINSVLIREEAKPKFFFKILFKIGDVWKYCLKNHENEYKYNLGALRSNCGGSGREEMRREGD